jgi:DNA-binding NtrC family response regulator
VPLRQAVARDAAAAGYEVAEWPGLAELLARPRGEAPDLVVVDHGAARPDAPRLLDRLITGRDGPPVLLMESPDRMPPVLQWLERGVVDVLPRPPHAQELRLRLARALSTRDVHAHLASLEEELTERSRRSFAERTLVARSEEMKALEETLDRVARMRTTVLVLGESGVGKELVARRLHFRSRRSQGPFVPINCAALPPHLIESELFGHERGAFTGAVSGRAGKFELAHEGTLFLDEIGETDLPTQAKLLRVLEQQEFMRVGGSRAIRVDVRLVAATNADVEALVREGRLREDLYYRLKVVTLDVPPLRHRREDIPELIEVFLGRICRTNHLSPRRLTAAALEALLRHDWPGNVRELQNTLEALVVSSPSETIDVGDLPLALQADRTSVPRERGSLAGRRLEEIEAEAIRSTLALTDGSRTRTAELLGISVRTLRRRIQQLGLAEDIPARPGRPRVP